MNENQLLAGSNHQWGAQEVELVMKVASGSSGIESDQSKRTEVKKPAAVVEDVPNTLAQLLLFMYLLAREVALIAAAHSQQISDAETPYDGKGSITCEEAELPLELPEGSDQTSGSSSALAAEPASTPPASPSVKRVRFSEEPPLVWRVPASSEHRGVQYSALLRGEGCFQRPVRHNRVWLLLSAAVDPEEHSEIAVTLSTTDRHDTAAQALLPTQRVILRAPISQIEDPASEEEQLRVAAQAVVLLDCAADMLREVGLRGIEPMVSGGVWLENRPSLPDQWGVRGSIVLSESLTGEWSYPLTRVQLQHPNLAPPVRKSGRRSIAGSSKPGSC